MDLNSERIHLNLFQTWFKLTITTMINLRLHEFNSGVLQSPPLLLTGSICQGFSSSHGPFILASSPTRLASRFQSQRSPSRKAHHRPSFVPLSSSIQSWTPCSIGQSFMCLRSMTSQCWKTPTMMMDGQTLTPVIQAVMDYLHGSQFPTPLALWVPALWSI
jgi:hypothetical protein